jgi:hypothetical protein
MNVDELDALGRDLFLARDRAAQIRLQLKTVDQDISEIERKLLAVFEENDKEKLHIKDYGLIFTQTRTSVKVPQGDAKDLFFKNLSFDEYHALRTVNSMTLNSWYKEKLELAVEQGEVDFKIPGLEDPTVTKTIACRKG